MPDQWSGPLLAGLAAIIIATMLLWRALIKSLIDLLREVRDVRRENTRLYKENADLIKVIQQDRAKAGQERQRMQAQIDKLTGYLNKLVPALRRIWQQNQELSEKVAVLTAANHEYRKQIRGTPPEGDK